VDKRNDLAAEVQDLVWALVDEQATDGQIHRLEELLLDNDDARRVYWSCMQMHGELYALLSGRQMRLPAVVESAVKQCERKKSLPLSVASFPPVTISVPLVDAAML